jgi:hypothetical protein
MLVSIDIDDHDKAALLRMKSECECWRVDRIIYLSACLGQCAAVLGTIAYALGVDDKRHNLIPAFYALPVSFLLLWFLRRCWHGQVWSGLAKKVTQAVDDSV